MYATCVDIVNKVVESGALIWFKAFSALVEKFAVEVYGLIEGHRFRLLLMSCCCWNSTIFPEFGKAKVQLKHDILYRKRIKRSTHKSGGYIGLFLGYSLLQFPQFLQTLYNRNKCKRQVNRTWQRL